MEAYHRIPKVGAGCNKYTHDKNGELEGSKCSQHNFF